MPPVFQFTQGTESRSRPNDDSSPLLGRYRAVAPRPSLGRRRSSQLGLLSSRLADAAGSRGSVHVGYGAIVAAQLEDELDSGSDISDNDGGVILWGDEDDNLNGKGWDLFSRKRWERRWRRWVLHLWVEPRQLAVKRVVDVWYSRYGTLVFLPAVLTVGWSAIPFPQYPFPVENQLLEPGLDSPKPNAPGHGAARVQVNFWFFLFVYYGFYNVTALIWITKVFNIYSLNWWPQSLGFPMTMALIAAISIAVPIPIYLIPSTRFLIVHNISWISWTFITMAIPVAIAFLILLTNERHIGLRNSLSDTQRIFTTSWWTGDLPEDTFSRRDRRRRNIPDDMFATDAMQVGTGAESRVQALATRRRWLPSSFVRFLWFCFALFVGLMAYVIGEAYAELYLRTLPHNNLETVVYVWGWVVSVHLLDALTGWVLGIRQGERVGSYPLSWVFKLYFMLTYQTYVRALYARLRSPSQFVILQLLSSTGLIILTPLMMTRFFHRVLTVIGLNTQSYGSYQKLQTRNIFIRFIAENATMSCFLGSVLVLHFGANKNVYPYFAFDGDSEPYDFNLTFKASSVTWGCELVASVIVRGLIRLFFKVDVGLEGKLDLAVWPELLPTCVAVTLHVLQNMMFSIIRLQFKAPS